MDKHIFRAIHDKENPYFMINSNGFPKDKTLSLSAKGLLVQLLSNKDDYQVSMAQLINESTSGRSQVESAMKELMEKGYVRKISGQTNRESGRVQKNIYKVFEIPAQFDEAKPAEPKQETSSDALTNAIAKLGTLKFAPLKHTVEMLKENQSLLFEINDYLSNGKTHSKAKITVAFLNKQCRNPSEEEKTFLYTFLKEFQPKQIEKALKDLGKVDNLVLHGEKLKKICVNEKQEAEKRFAPKPKTQKPAQQSTVSEFVDVDFSQLD